MTVAEYIVKKLQDTGVSDIFGIPGAVVLDFLYAADEEKENIKIHLSNHEQGAGYAALGYAQTSGKLGVAYATRGPGFTNLLTPIADAFFDSIPSLFITAHSSISVPKMKRFEEEQEFDTVEMVKRITKYAVRLDDEKVVYEEINRLLNMALSGRPGPVFLDINSSLLRSEIKLGKDIIDSEDNIDYLQIIEILKKELYVAKRPLLLIGNGIHQGKLEDLFVKVAKKLGMPVISSCISKDIMNSDYLYHGYIGSHGTREANFVLQNSDLIISFGNRLAYNRNSKTFEAVTKKKILRFDIDRFELQDAFNNEVAFCLDLRKLFNYLDILEFNNNWTNWNEACLLVQKIFDDAEYNYSYKKIDNILKTINPKYVLVSDVGNNEFYLSKSYRDIRLPNRLLMSKSFAALGCSLPKAIGAYYATKCPVVAFMGDQGMLFNIQELQFIVSNELPIACVVLNTKSSEMIMDKEIAQKRQKLLHTTLSSGYNAPDIKKLATGFGIKYLDSDNVNLEEIKEPILIEIDIANLYKLPYLPKGAKPYGFIPDVDNTFNQKIKEIEDALYE